MNYTIETIAKSLADYLAPTFPGVTFYEDPNQQGTKPPCLFLQQRYSNIRPQVGGFFMRTIGLDLVYLADYNLPNLQQLYQAVAESLDMTMETFPYSDGTESVRVRTYERKWDIDLTELHYQFELRARVKPTDDSVKMQRIESYTERVTE